MKNYKLVLFVLILSGGLGTSIQQKELPTQLIDKQGLLDRHNYYREQVKVAPLIWSDELAAVAQKWANHLANSCDLNHSSSSYGENLYWTSGEASVTKVVDKWAEEEKYFNHKNTVYKAGSGSKAGHYSQVIWRETTEMGGAMQKCKHGGEIWVCNYNPAGNRIGSKAY